MLNEFKSFSSRKSPKNIGIDEIEIIPHKIYTEIEGNLAGVSLKSLTVFADVRIIKSE
jgi:hypothetical protein